MEFSDSDDETTSVDLPVKRMAVIDSCNIMHLCAGKPLNCNPGALDMKPDALGMLVSARSLLVAGYDLQMLVPPSYMSLYKTANVYILEMLQRRGFLTEVTTGVHDDLAILEVAKSCAGFVITNDKYRDHIGRGLDSAIGRTVYCTAESVSLIKLGGTEAICDRANRYICSGLQIKLLPTPQSMYSVPDDPSYEMAIGMRSLRNEMSVRETLAEMDVMFDFIQQEVCIKQGVKPPKLPYYDPEIDDALPDYEKFKKWHDLHTSQLSETKRLS